MDALCYSGSIIHAILHGLQDQVAEVLNVRQRGQTVRTLSGIGCTANKTVQKMTTAIAWILAFGRESAATVAMTGQWAAPREHAELVACNVPEMLLAGSVHLRLGQDKLQLAFILIVPGRKLSVHVVVDRLLLGIHREMHANRSNDVVQLVGLLQLQQRYVAEKVILPTFVAPARD